MKLRLVDIKINYGKKDILNGVNLSLENGEFLTIFGESGSGKSTILKAITGLIDMKEGQVYLDDKEITNLETEKRGISYVFQEPHLFPHLTVRGNIAFGLEVKKYPKSEIKKKVNDLLQLLQIEELQGRYPSELSGGQQQRVSIARALAPDPSLILMDEPFSGLDRNLREEMGALIKNLQEKMNLTIVFVTHDLNECLRLSDSIAILKEGRILQVGKASSVYYSPKTKDIASLMGGGNWIKGFIQDEMFICDFTKLNAQGHKNGKVELFLRPHQIKITHEADNKFIIHGIRKLGKEIEVDVMYDDKIIMVETFDETRLELNKAVTLDFPKDKLYFIYEEQ